MRSKTLGRVAVMAVVAATTTACATRPNMEMGGGDVAAMGSMGSASGIVLTDEGMMFSDASIAAVGSASNQEEIQTSRLALERGTDQRVKSYAQRMIDEHTRVEEQMRSMMQVKGMVAVDNALSLQMKRNLPPKLDMLRQMNGTQFDMGYMMRQVHAHEMTLLSLDTSLIPEADDAQLKSYLRDTVRPAVAMHLQEAKQLHDAMVMAMQR